MMTITANHSPQSDASPVFDTHLQRRLLDGDLAEDSSAVVGTNRLQLLLVEREELSAGQNAEAGDGAAGRKETVRPDTPSP